MNLFYNYHPEYEQTKSPLFYLFGCSHEVDGRVVTVVFLQQAEGELVIDQQVV